jgi:uncharacterized cupredoxin-like copper-binding protein
MRRRTSTAAIAVTLAAVIGLAACGGDDDDSATASTTAPDAPTTTASDATAPTDNQVVITATDYAFNVSGPVHTGPVDVVLDNVGKAYHMVESVPLKDGVTADDLAAAAKKGEDAMLALAAGDPENDAVYGLPGMIAPGAKVETVTTIPKAGTYGLLCFVPGPDGQPHVMLGMTAILEVTDAGATTSTVPDTDATITLSDTGIDMPDAASTGSGWFAVKNEGTAPHTISIAQLPGDTTLDADYQWFGEHFAKNEPLEGAPGDLIGGLNNVPPGETAYVHLDLPAGHYGYISTEGEPPNDDYSKGLKGEFDVE